MAAADVLPVAEAESTLAAEDVSVTIPVGIDTPPTTGLDFSYDVSYEDTRDSVKGKLQFDPLAVPFQFLVQFWFHAGISMALPRFR